MPVDYKLTSIDYFISKQISKAPLQYLIKKKPMQPLSIITTAFSAWILISCSSQNTGTAGNTSNTSNAAIDAIPVSSNSGKGTITCNIDGKPISIIVQNGSFEMPLSHNPKDPKDGLELLDGSTKKEGFQFEIKNTGITNIDAEYGNSEGCGIGYYNSTGQLYAGTKGEITVTSFSGGHLTGIFSGKFQDDERKKIPIQITDGKFDLIR